MGQASSSKLGVSRARGRSRDKSTSDLSGTKFYLCGFPILHSASPDFHNYIFSLLENEADYTLHSTSKVTSRMIEMLRNDECGGASVTMPIKVAIIPHLDGVTPEGQHTGAVNTIVKVLNPETGKRELIGTNTDFLGIRNALLRALRLQHPSALITPDMRYAPGMGSALVIGGGATTRSAVYAVHTLGLCPIFLVNRDKEEIEAVRDSFPHLKNVIVHIDTVARAEALLAPEVGSDAPLLDGEPIPPIFIAVGAIPAIPPQTSAERSVYTIVTSILTIPYHPPSLHKTLETSSPVLPAPTTRLFLEMPYKPRLTPMLRIASALGWDTIDGIQAMIEQGLAQQRMWKAGDASIAVGSDPNGLGPRIDGLARVMVENMKDVVVREEEIDLSLEND